jgi:hypothetical protein
MEGSTILLTLRHPPVGLMIHKDLLQKYQNTDAKRGAVLTAHKTYVVQMMGVVGRVDFHSV